MVRKNKKGWIRLLEAFVSIVLLTSVLLVVSNMNSSPKTTLQDEIAKKEVAILRDIQLNEDLRAEVLAADVSDTIVWEDFDSSGLSEVRNRIEVLAPKELECSAQLCIISNPCTLEDNSGKEVYAKSAVISANITTYSPRQLKLFCTKE